MIYVLRQPIKVITLLIFMILCFSSPIQINAQQQQTQYVTIHVRSLIDGLDYIHLQGNQFWFHHETAQLPGTFNGADQPTFVNNFEWYPYFADEAAGPQDSDSLTDETFIPDAALIFHLNNVSVITYDPSEDPVIARGEFEVGIDQQPTPANKYELIVKLDDDAPNGAAWMEFTLYAGYYISNGNTYPNDNGKPQTLTSVIEETSVIYVNSTTPQIALLGFPFITLLAETMFSFLTFVIIRKRVYIM